MFQQKATQTERLPAFHSRNMSCGLYGIVISNNEINLHFSNWDLSVLVLVFGRICVPDVRWFMAQGLYTTSGLLEYCSCRSSGFHYALFCYKSRICNQRCTQIYMSKSLSLYCMIYNFCMNCGSYICC